MSDLIKILLQAEVNPKSIQAIQSQINQIHTTPINVKVNTTGQQGIVGMTDALEKLENVTKKNLMLDLERMSGRYKNLVRPEDVSNIKSMISSLSHTDPKLGYNIDLIRTKMKEVSVGAEQSRKAMDLANKSAMSFGEAMKTAAYKFGIWSAITGSYYKVIREISTGIKFITEMDTALTEIGTVTVQTREQTAGLAREYNNLAKQMKVLTSDITSGAVEFYRQGLSQQEVMERLKTTTLYSKITGMEFKQSAETLTATVNSMGISIERAADVFTYLGDATATSGAEIGVGFSKTGGAAAALNVEFEKVASWIAVISAKTRESAESIGHSINTMLSRMSRITSTGFDEEDGTKINDVAKALNSIGIVLMDSHGKFRDFGTIMDEVGAKFGGLNDKQKSYIANTMAGTRQQSRFFNLMGGYSESIELYKESLESAGTAQDKFDIYLESNRANLDKMRTSIQGLWLSFLDSDGLMNIVKIATSLFESLDTLTQKFGSLATLSNILIPLIGVKLVGAFKAAFLSLVQLNSANNLSTAFNVSNIKEAIAVMFGLKTATDATTTSTVALTVATSLLKASLVLLPVAILAITNAERKRREEMEKTIETSQKLYKNLDEVDKLTKRMDEITSSNSTNIDEKKELLDIQRKLAELYPEVANGIDEEGNRIAENTGAVKELVKEKKRLLELQLLAAKSTAEESLQSDPEKLLKTQKKIAEIQQKLLSGDTVVQSNGMIIDKRDKMSSQLAKLLEQEQQLQDKIKTSADVVEQYNKIVKERALIEVQGQLNNIQSQGQYEALKKHLLDAGYSLEEFYELLKTTKNETEKLDDSMSPFVDTIQDLYKSVSTAVDEYDLFKQALKELNEEGQVSKSTLDKLIEIYPNIIQLTGLQKDKMIELMNTSRDKRRQMIDDEIASAKATSEATVQRILNVKNEAEALRELANIKLQMRFIDAGNSFDDPAIDAQMQRNVENARKAMAVIEETNRKIQALEGMRSLFNEVDNKYKQKPSSSTSVKEEYKAIADEYERINQLLADNNNMLEMNKRYITDAKEGSAEQLTLIKKENSLYKERQNLLNQLNQQRRAEAIQLEKDLSKEGFKFTGSGDARRISNLDNIKGKSKEVEEMFKRFNELQTSLIPQTSQQWWDYQKTIVDNIAKIESTIQSHIDQLSALQDELANFDLSGKIADLNKQLDAAKFNHWIESLILGLERYNDKTELLTFKLSLFDEEDYENRANVVGDLFEASQDKLKTYREEWDKLSKQTPKNANEASQIASAMKQVQVGMREAFVATREYQRELEKIQFNAISNEFAKANKQLELQLSIIDHNLQSLKDGVLPDFSLDMVMPIPDFSDIFDEAASENEKIYNEQVDFEKQIQELKKQSLAMQLAEAEDFYANEMNKLMEHYNEILAKIAEKEAEIAELQSFLNEEQKKQLEAAQEAIRLQIEEDNQAKLEAEEKHGEVIEEEKLAQYKQLMEDLISVWLDPETSELISHSTVVEGIISSHLSALQSSYSGAWSGIVGTVSSSVATIQSLVAQANAAIASIGSVPVVGGSSGSGISSGSGTTVSKYAKGTSGHKGGLSLVGEKGVELGVLPSGKTILLGKNGSELVDIPVGTEVIPNSETMSILSHTGNIDGQTIPKYASGTRTWQERLKDYENDPEALQAEKDRVNDLLDSGKAPDKAAAERWLSQIESVPVKEPERPKQVNGSDYGSYIDTSRKVSELPGIRPDQVDEYDLIDGYLRKNSEKYEIIERMEASMSFLGDKYWNKSEQGSFWETTAMQKYGFSRNEIDAMKSKYGIDTDDTPYVWRDGESQVTRLIKEKEAYNAKRNEGAKPLGGGSKSDYEYYNPGGGSGGSSGGGSYTPTKPPTFNELIGVDKPDFFAEMSKEFKEGTGKYSEGIFDLSGFEGYDKYLEDRKVTLEEIKDLQQAYLEGTGEQISKEEILAKIDAQMLEDAKTQSWLKVDLLEQMKDNVAEYTQSLKEKYDESLASGNTELARQIFEEYNNMLSKSMQIENQIQQAIKQRYEMEFALIEKKLNKQNQIMDELEYQKSLIETLNPDNIIGISDIYKEMADHTSDQVTYLYEILNQLSEQQSLLEVGSNEWNIINGQVDSVVSKIRSANLEMAKMAKSAFTGFAGIFKDDTLGRNPKPSSPERAEDDSDKWLEGLEKQLEIEKLMKYVEENKLTLNKKQLEIINEQGRIRKKELDVVRKELELQQLLVKIENLRNQKTIQQLTKKEDGTWDFEYVADMDAINKVEDQILDAKLAVIHAEKDLRKELQAESEKAAQDAAKAAQEAYDQRIKGFEEVLKNAEQRMYKSAEEFRAALENTGLEFAEGWLDSAVDEYWKYFTTTAEIFVKEALEKTKQALEQQSKAFESIGNENGKNYVDGLLSSIDEIMSGEGDIVQKQQAIIDMLASKYSEFVLAGNKNGMSFINGLISSMETADYQYSANEMFDKIVQAMEERLKELEGTGQNAGRALIEGLLASMDDIANNDEIEDKLLAILALLDKTDEYGTLGQALGEEFMQGLTDTLTNVTDEISGEGEGVLSEALNTMITMLDSKISDFAEKGDIQGLAYAEALRVKLQDALENAELTQEDIILLLAEFKDFDLAGLLSGEAYGDSLTEGLIGAEENAKDKTSAIVEGLNEDVESFADAGTAQGEAYKAAITTAFESAIDTAKSLVGSLIDYVNSSEFNINVGVSDNLPSDIEGFASGGYTGSFDGGKLGVLHEKEVILNKVDTENFLKAINVTRDIFSNIKAPTIPKMQPVVAGGGGDQVFHINKLEFPNVKDGKDLQDAILNLPLIAKQKVRTT